MEMTVSQEGGVAIVAIPLESLDASNSKEFKRVMAPLLEQHKKIIFDMSHLRFVDSSGLVAILSCLRQLNAVGGDVKLFGMAKLVRVLFELVRMHRIFDILNTKEEALRAFTS